MSAYPMRKVSVVYLFALALHVSAKNAYKVIPIITGVQLKDNLNYLNSSAQTYNASEHKIDFSINLKTPLVNPWLNLITWVDVASGALKAPLQNKSINFCKFLRNPSMHRLGQIILREVKRSGNAPTKCPFPAKLYQFRSLSTGELRLPLFLPENEFVIDIVVGVSNNIVYNSRWHGMLRRVQCTSNRRC
ncbi:uncharacterized protein LOC126568521 [Anopheles maculipalpis]|uniref:uncharacterized protein LOC126568521 n=1 Tax=Anopheles maculipalpis TaxID=1496333 RepID=UPI002159A1FD|nr:uncharacterized protein LOC126568521 [Anopheles maculipalpis]